MLYITTSDTKAVYTAPYTLSNDRGQDGGVFMPYVLPQIDRNELRSWKDLGFSQVVAKVLNMFFPTQLTGWDVDFYIGRNSIRLLGMSRMLMLAEIWHNPEGSFSYAVGNLYRKTGFGKGDAPTEWFCVAVRIAYLFALYYEMVRAGEITINETFDVCVGTDDISEISAAFYAVQMGLPIERIVCTCVGFGDLWDLIHRGTYNPAMSSPEHRGVLERIIYATLGEEELARFRTCFETKRIFSVSEELLPRLSESLFCVVTGKERASSGINSVYRNSGQLVSTGTALYCGGVQDYRAKSGESRLTLILIREDPKKDSDAISKAVGIAPQKLWVRSN